MKDLIPEGAAIVQHAFTMLDGELTGMIGFVVRTKRAGTEMMHQAMYYAVPSGGHMILVACTVTGLADNAEAVSQLRLKYMPAMQKAAATLVLLDKRKK